VALYGRAGKRWTMTERSRASMSRSAHAFHVGPSQLAWDGATLVIDVDERGMPLPHRVRGRVRVHPAGLSTFNAALDARGRHRWGPIAPCARVEVNLESPRSRWSGHAYLDSNEGDELIDRAFTEWDWSRATLADGSTAVIYDVRQKAHGDRVLAFSSAGPIRAPRDRVLALRFSPQGVASDLTAPERQPLPRTLWRIARTMRSDAGVAPHVRETLEDTPFYTRSVIESGLLGERVVSMHETLDARRLASRAVQLMLPWRMPRVR
jgi:carotenoid 1,2-hydratase